ncbi:hypothetical protein DFJ63DRAFT_100124 [Scheffersomyces coipomensis]|uniref:uncharacterized protein n=1 Tax=Scheffersomyces coipomensis TaxID=1788519 RepID=UPI00315D727E
MKSHSFSFPEKASKSNKKGSSNKLKVFTHSKSYPLISTSVDGSFSFADSSFLSPEVEDPKSKENNFRSRNKYFVARNALGKLISSEYGDYRFVSKVTALMWQQCSKRFNGYCEYLSAIDSFCYDELSSKKDDEEEARYKMSSKEYQLTCRCVYMRKEVDSNSRTSHAIRFRVQKNQVKRPRHRIIKLSSKSQLQHYVFNRKLGIFTEDVFT